MYVVQLLRLSKVVSQYHSSTALILWRSAFFTILLSHPYMTTAKTIALTIWTFAGKVMSLLFNMLSRFVIAFLPRSKYARAAVNRHGRKFVFVADVIVAVAAVYHHVGANRSD